ncbi:MAG TPA: urease accessory protein [Phaeodactylibacter sp.]|nr:urease accessory protein [Phaeodactylibacter sp.]
MEASFPLLFAAVVGFGHAFEADHLVAVSNIVTKRDKFTHAIKDGLFWGLGHTSTIFLIGLIMIVGKSTFLNGLFHYFEAAVGVMLILLGVFRLYQFFNKKKYPDGLVLADGNYQMAYGIGLVHGLAGSGAMVLLVMTNIQSNFNSMLYLLIFGIGSMAGMLVAAGIFSLPFSKKITKNRALQMGLVFLSSLLCIGYGGYVLLENL